MSARCGRRWGGGVKPYDDFPDFGEPFGVETAHPPVLPPPRRYPKSIKWLLSGATIGIIAGLMGYGIHRTPNASTATAEGWDALRMCSNTSSLDGKRRLLLAENQLATLQVGHEPPQQGRWSYDAANKKYIIGFGSGSASYALLSQDDITTCVLVKGDLAAANLWESWFERIPEPDEQEERERDWPE